MPEQIDSGNYSGNYSNFNSIKLKDLEEKQGILKDRLLLIGQNLIDTKDEHDGKILEIKKDLEILKSDVERIKSFLESISSELGKFARKEDLEILSKQAKMFQPLSLIKKTKTKI